MKLVEKIIGIKKENKIISLEYFLGIFVAFTLWGYHLIRTGIISQEYYTKYGSKIDGLADSHFDWKRDYTDFQWRNFRQSLPIIFVFAAIFLTLSSIVKRFFSSYIKQYYLLIGLGYGVYLHNVKILILLLLLLVNFSFTKIYDFLGKFYFTFITWIFGCSVKILSEIYSGFSLRHILPKLGIDIEIDEDCMIQWHLVFGLIMLRMISFNMEYKRVKESLIKKEEIILVSNSVSNTNSNTNHHCEDCENNFYCLKFLTDAGTNLSDYTFINYLIYIFYPPLYFSGPTVLFNSFIFQINNIDRSKHQKTFLKEKLIYIIRYIFVFVCFEIFNSFIYVNAYLTNGHNKFLWSEFDYYTCALFCFFLLIFIWFKFTIIWRTSRTWAWMDGILVEENMNRCMYNNYSFEGFWRAWHRSFNVWLIRYIYIPLGGSKNKICSIWIVFNFVALWHDLQLNLLLWGWFICLFFVPEIMVKQYFNNEKRKYLHELMWFRLIKYLACSFYIVLMIIANLIGFGMGFDGFYQILVKMLQMTSLGYLFKILLFLMPSVVVMFYVREKERMNLGNKKAVYF